MPGNTNILVTVAAAALITTGCSSAKSQPMPSTPASQTLLAPAWTPPNGHPMGTATRVTAGNPIDPKVAESALLDPTVKAELRGRALEIASAAGVTLPKTIIAVAIADHQEAETVLSGAVINDHAPVHVITLTGGPFTSVRHPVGAPAPQGNVLTLTFDAASRRLTDVGFVETAPDLSGIGSRPVDLTQ